MRQTIKRQENLSKINCQQKPKLKTLLWKYKINKTHGGEPFIQKKLHEKKR